MRKTIALLILASLCGFLGGRLRAQSAVLQFTGAWAAHTACVVTVGQTSLCLASDGVWQSINGAAFTQLGAAVTTAGGVTSVTVCNAAGAACGLPQTGVVQLSIPTKVTVTAPSATLQ